MEAVAKTVAGGEVAGKAKPVAKAPSVILAKAATSKLLAAVNVVAGVIERRTTIPILTNVMLCKRGETLELTGTDLELQMRSQAEIGHGEAEIATTVNARKLVEMLRAMPAEQVTTLTLTGEKLVVTGGKSRFTVQTMPAADFPLVQSAKEVKATIKIAQKTLASLIRQVQYAMASHDIRHYLNGMLLETDGNEVRVVATDGHRLATTKAEVETAMDKTSVILPRKAVGELSRLLSQDEGDAEIVLTENHATFRFNGLEFTTKLVEGKFPDYKRVIPKSNKTEVTFERDMVLRSLERANLLANEKFKGVRLCFAGSTLTIESSNADQEQAIEEIGIDFEGEKIEIGFNVVFLIAALSNMTSDTVKFALKDGESSALLTEPDAPELRAVVMPMRI